jgi:hypothetical protein
MTNLIGVPAYRRVVVPRIDNNSIPVIESTGYVETTEDVASVDYGINPCIWKALPNQAVIVWKVRHPVTTTGATLPVNVVIPAANRNSTVVSDTTNIGATKIPVIDNKSTQVLGHDVTVPSGTAAPAPQVQAGYFTEHIVYINKCCGIFRLMGITAINSPAAAAVPNEQQPAAASAKK